MERDIPPQERLTLREKLQRLGQHAFDGLILFGQAHTGIIIDLTETQGHRDIGISEAEAFANDPHNH